MNPLASEIWIYIILAYVLVSITMWIVARFSPFEWQITKPPTCDNYLADRLRRKRKKTKCKCEHDVDELPEKKQLLNEEDDGSEEEVDDDMHENNHEVIVYERDVKQPNWKIVADDGIGNERNADDAGSVTYEWQPDDDEKPTDVCDQEFCEYHHTQSASTNFVEEPHNCDFVDCDGFQETELLCSENDFTLKNSFWFTIGTLMQQGSDVNPKVFVSLMCFFSPFSIYIYLST